MPEIALPNGFGFIMPDGGATHRQRCLHLKSAIHSFRRFEMQESFALSSFLNRAPAAVLLVVGCSSVFCGGTFKFDGRARPRCHVHIRVQIPLISLAWAARQNATLHNALGLHSAVRVPTSVLPMHGPSSSTTMLLHYR